MERGNQDDKKKKSKNDQIKKESKKQKRKQELEELQNLPFTVLLLGDAANLVTEKLTGAPLSTELLASTKFENFRIRGADLDVPFEIIKFPRGPIDAGLEKISINYFDSVSTMIFVFSLDNCDLRSPDMPEMNHLQASFALFTRFATKPEYTRGVGVLYLYSHTFREKLMDNALKDVFPDLKGNTIEDVMNFLRQKMAKDSQRTLGKGLFIYFEESNQNIPQSIFKIAKDIVLESALQHGRI